MAATLGTHTSDGAGWMAFAQSARTLPGAAAPSSVVRSTIEMARSIASALAAFLIDRVARRAARSSAPSWSTLGSPVRKRRSSAAPVRVSVDSHTASLMGRLGTKQARYERTGPVLAGCGKSAGTEVQAVPGRVVRNPLGEGDATRPDRRGLKSQRGQVYVVAGRTRRGHAGDRVADDVHQLRVPAAPQQPQATGTVPGDLREGAVALVEDLRGPCLAVPVQQERLVTDVVTVLATAPVEPAGRPDVAGRGRVDVVEHSGRVRVGQRELRCGGELPRRSGPVHHGRLTLVGAARVHVGAGDAGDRPCGRREGDLLPAGTGPVV